MVLQLCGDGGRTECPCSGGRGRTLAAYHRSMTSPDQWQAQLTALSRPAWAAYLDDHSGLPGPRGNTSLATAVARVADEDLIDELLESGGEFHAMCAAAATARRAQDLSFSARARALASDARWRVREGVAIGLQLLGDEEPSALGPIVLDWADDPDPLVQRAAVAAICEPRLLRTPEAAAMAIEVCRRTTGHLASLEPAARRDPDVRTLRQALGYGWSVAVAADPGSGLPTFRALDTDDPDVGWIVSQNLRKARLATLIDQAPGSS